ncbi:MAG: hypothetical protein HGA19_05600 [Oscillochloris sp.]|nr:hypothetical protein [Oscillochloris sp.]
MRCRNALLLCVLIGTLLPTLAYADMAPPEQPSGGTISPDTQTKVRMQSEQVILMVEELPSSGADDMYAGDRLLAHVDAHFQMHNLGDEDEVLQARFPLQNPDGSGHFQADEIQDFQVTVGDVVLPTTIITQPITLDSTSEPIRWAAFDLTFPVHLDLDVHVRYVTRPTGYYPAARFAYILETGAGWRDSIGSADIMLKLPSSLSKEAILPNLPGIYPGTGATTPGGIFGEKQIRWHWENLEPTAQDNLFVTIIAPTVWQAVLDAREAVATDPKSSDALVQLAKSYDRAITSYQDHFALLSEEAYAKALAISPNSARLHAEYGLLIVQHLMVQALLPTDDPQIQRALQELNLALAIDPAEPKVHDLTQELLNSVDGELQIQGDRAILVPTTSTSADQPTATLMATAMATPVPTATATAVLSPTALPTTTPLTPAPPIGVLPLSLGLVILIGTGVLVGWLLRRRR